jgi:hypothetical protein
MRRSRRLTDLVLVGGELMVDHDRLVHQDLAKIRAEVDRRIEPQVAAH